MARKKNSATKTIICMDRAIKYALYSLVFLLPLFFLPLTSYPVFLNKQMLFLVVVSFSLILWIIKSMISGKIVFLTDRVSNAVFLFLIIIGVSTIFSINRTQSFWGRFSEPDAFLNLALCAALFFLISNVFKEKEEVMRSLVLFFLSGVSLAVLFLAQYVFDIFPWDFANVSGFNPAGSGRSLALFLGGAFLVLIGLISSRPLKEPVFENKIQKKGISVLTIISGFLILWVLFLVNWWVGWMCMALALALLILSGLYSKDVDLGHILRDFAFPLFLFVLALILVFIKTPLSGLLNLPLEVGVTHELTLSVAVSTLKQSAKNLFFGSGPATFAHQFSLFKSPEINLTDFWQARFSQGFAVIPTFLVCFGILGIGAVLFLMASFFSQGLKEMVKGKKEQRALTISFVAGFYFFISWFFYPASFILIFSAFLMLGLWLASTKNRAKKEISLFKTPKRTFFLMISAAILVSLLIILVYASGRRYLGAVKYSQGLQLFSKENNLEQAILKVDEAVFLDKNDAYFRTLSDMFSIKIGLILNNNNLT